MPHQGFRPFCGLLLQMGETSFEFLPHPSFPDKKECVFCLEGSTAFLYKMRKVGSREVFALKVFKPDFRTKQIAAIAASLTRHEDLAALQAKRRRCITQADYPKLVSTYPELEYAILMPWISEPTWAEFLLDPQLSADYTYGQALSLARATAHALSELEARGLAHADIASKNAVPAPDRQHIHLLDLESMYIPGLPPPQQKSQGTSGYQHQFLDLEGQWGPEGDRFAGAILLTEMLTWWNPRVRANVDEQATSLFKPEELQGPETPSVGAVRETLRSLSPPLLELFDQAWRSRTLAECPPLRAWAAALGPVHAFAGPRQFSGRLQDHPSLNGSRPMLSAPAAPQLVQPAPVLVETHTPPVGLAFASALPAPGPMDTPPARPIQPTQGLRVVLTQSQMNPPTTKRKSSSTLRKSLLLAMVVLMVLAGSGLLLFRNTTNAAPQLRPTSTTSEQSRVGSSGITAVASPTTPGQTPTRTGPQATPATGAAPGPTPTAGTRPQPTPRPTSAPQPTPTPTFNPATCPPEIENGSTGQWVSNLQDSLNALYTEGQFTDSPYDFAPYSEGNTPLAVDGIFGPDTENATKDYQTAMGLEVDGVVGPYTWHSLGWC